MDMDDDDNEDHIVDNIISSEEEEEDEVEDPVVSKRPSAPDPPKEVIVISDSDDPDDSDPELTKGIWLSLKQKSEDSRRLEKSAPKRNGEGTSTAEAAERKRPKLVPVAVHKDFDAAFAAFLEALRPKVGSAGDFERVRKKLERSKARIGAEHLESAALRDVLARQEEAVKLDVGGENTFVFLELIVEEFKRRRSDPAAEDEVEDAPAPGESPKYRSQIRELDAKLNKLFAEIQRLESEEDVEVADEDKFTAKCQTSNAKIRRYKDRALKIYKKLAKLEGCEDETRKYREAIQ